MLARDAIDTARKTLRHAVWQLRVALGASGGRTADRVLRADREWMQYVADEEVWLDAAAFEEAVRRSRLESAVELYRNELLQGWGHDWCVGERERLRLEYLEALDALIARCERENDRKAAMAYGLTALQHDPSRESTHRVLMRLHATAGDRLAALRQYERCALALRELGLTPEEETRALAARIRGGR